MHVIAWLLTQRAVAAGELPPRDALHPSRRLGAAPVSDGDAVSGMPAAAGQLVAASADLYRRVARLDAAQSDAASPRSEEHTSELQSLMRISYAVFCLKKKKTNKQVRLPTYLKHKNTKASINTNVHPIKMK